MLATVRTAAPVLACLVVAAGCGGKRTASEGGADDGGAADRAAARRLLDPDGRWLLARRHDDEAARARYAAIRFGDADGAHEIIELGERPALPHTRWPGHYREVSAHEGWRWAHAEPGDGDGGYRVVVHDARGGAGASPERVLDLGALEPTGLHLVGDTLLVGGAGGVLLSADLAAPAPSLTEQVRRGVIPKGYDLFARHGDRLVAIDDVVTPIFADWFELTARGLGRRLGDWTLPDLINGTYRHAALEPGPAADEHTLYLVSAYGVLDGHGHNVVALRVAGDQLVDRPRHALPNADATDRVLGEHVSRATGEPQELLAGATYTPLGGLAVDAASGRILLAAGARGLLVVPADFDRRTRGELVDLGGAVADVRVHGGRTLALVIPPGAAHAELVALAWDGASYAPAARHRLPAPYDRLVR
jgi:hypothetical protein